MSVAFQKKKKIISVSLAIIKILSCYDAYCDAILLIMFLFVHAKCNRRLEISLEHSNAHLWFGNCRLCWSFYELLRAVRLLSRRMWEGICGERYWNFWAFLQWSFQTHQLGWHSLYWSCKPLGGQQDFGWLPLRSPSSHNQSMSLASFLFTYKPKYTVMYYFFIPGKWKDFDSERWTLQPKESQPDPSCQLPKNKLILVGISHFHVTSILNCTSDIIVLNATTLSALTLLNAHLTFRPFVPIPVNKCGKNQRKRRNKELLLPNYRLLL